MVSLSLTFPPQCLHFCLPHLVSEEFWKVGTSFCTATCTWASCSTPRVCGWCYGNNREIAPSPFGCTVPMQCRDGISPRCLLLASPPVLPVSYPVPTLHQSSSPLFSSAPSFLSPSGACIHLPFPLLPSLVGPWMPHLLKPSPGLWFLICLPAAVLLPWAPLPPSSVFPLTVHVACSLLVSWNTNTSLTGGNENTWK